jgi:hypothetical protein
MTDLTELLKDKLIQLKYDLVNYSSKCLKVVTNSGDLVDFNLNHQQILVHQQIEKQLLETGKVRVIILKSRKLGMSTYAAARFIHKTTLGQNKRAAVITHVSDSTSAIFRVYKRFYENLPAVLKPSIKANNAKELEFKQLDSSIKVATAGASETGRGDTVHYLHCSEIAFWPNAREIAAGLMRSVADVDGTEIIIESTATDISTMFYDLWTDATAGNNGYLPIFLPWTVDPHCRATVPPTVGFSDEEIEYKRLYDLSDEQLFWRRLTLRQLGDKKFKQEYPISAAEAFAGFDTDSFIQSETVINARKREILKDNFSTMPLILGVDVAAMGDDKTCIVWRQGDIITQYKLFEKMRNEEVAEQLINIINKDKPAKVFIDGTGGYGAGVAAILRMRGYASEEINFGSKSSIGEYANKRCEMYANLRDWLEREVSIPDEDVIESDLVSFGYKHDIQGRLLLESKVDVKKRLKRSPDVGDAMALTFAYEIGSESITTSNWDAIRSRNQDYSW